jgi:hypothetical protein
VASPPLPVGTLKSRLIERAAGIGFQIVQTFLRLDLSLNNHVHMIGAYVRSPQTPASMRTYTSNSLHDNMPPFRIEQIGELIHVLHLSIEKLRVTLHQSAPRHVVKAVYRTNFLSVQVRTITGKRNQVAHIFLSTHSLTVGVQNDAPLKSICWRATAAGPQP